MRCRSHGHAMPAAGPIRFTSVPIVRPGRVLLVERRVLEAILRGS
jgi:hypothetical protein